MFNALAFFLLINFALAQYVPFFMKNYDDHSENEIKSLNTSFDPCTDFYHYSCFNWMMQTKKPKSEIQWSANRATHFRIQRRLEIILKSNDSNSASLKKAQKFYTACMNAENYQQQYLKGLRSLVEFLKGWPLVQGVKWHYDRIFNWAIEVVEIYKYVGVQAILKFSVTVDYKNNTNNALYIKPGNYIFPQGILQDPASYSAELVAYQKWIFDTVQYLYKNQTNKAKVLKDVSRIVEFEIKLAKINTKSSSGKKMSIQKLTRKLPINWIKLFNYMFSDQNIIFKETDVVVVNISYLKKLFLLIKRTDNRTIANYLIWCVVKQFSRETSSHLSHLNFQVNKAVYGIQSDVSRKVECIHTTNSYFQLAIIPEYVRKHLAPKTIQNVNEMFGNIREEFVKLLRANDWLSEQTRNLAVEKVRNMKSFVGFPQWVLNDTALNNYYGDIEMTDNHFLNVIKVERFFVNVELAQLNRRVRDIVWPPNVFEVNAYYSVLQNSIFIPLGILEPPYYQADYPNILNYGSLGSLIGHEISHSLDTSGRQANKDGNIISWWPPIDIVVYVGHTRCFEDSYTNGERTLGENIADSTGLQISYAAFLNQHKFVASLNNAKRNFFIRFAQMWCTKSDQFEWNFDDHSIPRHRVVQTLFNDDNFASTFKCNQGSTAVEKCKLW